MKIDHENHSATGRLGGDPPRPMRIFHSVSGAQQPWS
jgi:hypothetical protein